MPVARGKKKTRRERRRFGSPYVEGASTTAAAGAPVNRSAARSGRTSGSRPVKRPPLPLWANTAIGTSMLVFGILFAISAVRSKSGLISGWQPLIFVGYAAVASIYLGRAVAQVRERRQVG